MARLGHRYFNEIILVVGFLYYNFVLGIWRNPEIFACFARCTDAIAIDEDIGSRWCAFN